MPGPLAELLRERAAERLGLPESRELALRGELSAVAAYLAAARSAAGDAIAAATARATACACARRVYGPYLDRLQLARHVQ